MNRQEFIEYMDDLHNVFSGKEGVDLLLESDVVKLTKEGLIGQVYQKAINAAIGLIKFKRIPANIALDVISPIVNDTDAENTSRESAETAYEQGLRGLGVNNDEAAEHFEEAARKFFDFVIKDKERQRFLLFLHLFDPNFYLRGYYSKIEYYSTRAFLSSLLAAYCYKQLRDEDQVEICLKVSQFCFYLKLFYLCHKIELKKLKERIDDNSLKYRIAKNAQLQSENVEDVYNGLKEEEQKFIDILKGIFDKEIPMTFDDNYEISTRTVENPNVGISYVHETAFDWIPSIFKDKEVEEYWKVIIEN